VPEAAAHGVTARDTGRTSLEFRPDDGCHSGKNYLVVTNGTPKPYVWTATAESILAKVQRARTTFDRVVTQ